MTRQTNGIGAGTPTTIAYNPDGSIYSRTNGNGFKAVFSYDFQGRVTAIEHKNASNALQESFGYTYDLASNVLQNTHNIVGLNSRTTNYTYDRANRLLTEARTGGTIDNFSIVYAYDKNGSRTSVTRNGTPSSYSVDDNDKMLSGDGYTFSGYDGNGSPGTITRSGSPPKTFTYDFEARVKTVSGTAANSFVYNGEGQRVAKTDSTGTTRYVYDGATVIAETNGTGFITAYYLPGVGFVATAGAVTYPPQAPTIQYYYRENALGSYLATTDANGGIINRTEYDGYGNEYRLQTSIGGASYFRFAGRHGYVTDPDTGMDLLGLRYYLPGVGRFLTQDPIGHKAGLNLYRYCDDNPLGKVDPDGLQGSAFLEFNRLMGPPSSEALIAGARIAFKEVGSAVHPLLDFLSFFDPTPTIDSFNSAWYALEGDYDNAALSGLGAYLPFVNGTAAKVASQLYKVNRAAMAAHTSGKVLQNGVLKSQFLYRLNADEIVMQAARHADKNGLWRGNKAKVLFNSPIGVHGQTGELTRVVNVYRNNKGVIHGAPGSPN